MATVEQLEAHNDLRERIAELEAECGRLREAMQGMSEAHARSQGMLQDSLSVAFAARDQAWKERDLARRQLLMRETLRERQVP